MCLRSKGLHRAGGVGTDIDCDIVHNFWVWWEKKNKKGAGVWCHGGIG